VSARCNGVLAAALVAGFLCQSAVAGQNAAADGKRVALISELSGTAVVEGSGSPTPSAVKRFTALPDGSILRLGPGSRAVVVLVRGRRFTLGPGARATVHGDRVSATSGPVEELPSLPALPQLVALTDAPRALGGVRLRASAVTGLSPSNGAALASRARLRFAPVAGAATYRVEIEDGQGRGIFTSETASAEVAVPAGILEAGADYYWTVRTIDRPGAQARGSAGFRTLRPDEARARDDLAARLRGEGGAPALALLAAIDRHLGLHQEALEGFRAALALAPGDAALEAAIRDLEGDQQAAGIVVEAVTRGSAGEQAGIQPGDVLTSWTRAAAPPANPDPAKGLLASPFDLLDLEVEQGARGRVTLHGTRRGQPLAIDVPQGRWRITARPPLGASSAELHTNARAAYAAGDVDGAVLAWRRAADAERTEGSLTAAVWLLLEAGGALRGARKADEAHGAAREALALAERTKDAPVIAAVMEAQALAYETQSDLEQVEAAFRRVLDLRRSRGGTPLLEAGALNDIARSVFMRGDSRQGEQLLGEAIDIQQAEAPQSLALARSKMRLGSVKSRMNLDAAEPLIREAAALFEQLVPETEDFAGALNNLGEVATGRGDFPSAERLHQRALAIRRGIDPSGRTTAASLHNLGLVSFYQGRFAEAERLYRQALAVFAQQASGGPDEATVWNSLGSVLLQRGDLEGAEHAYLSALQIREKVSPGNPAVAATLHNLGLVSYVRADPARAEEYFRRALELERGTEPRSLTAASILNSIGMIASDRGANDDAERFYREALAIREQQAPGSDLVATSLNNLAELAESQGHTDRAYELYDRARLTLEKAAPDTPKMAMVLGNLGDVAVRRGQVVEAARLFDRALALTRRLAPDTVTHAEALRRAASLASRNGDLPDAAALLDQAVSALEAQGRRLGGAEDVRAGFSTVTAGIYAEYVDTLLALNREADAFAALERSRARAFLNTLAERDLVFEKDLSPALVRARQDLNHEYDQVQASLADLDAGRDAAEIDRLHARMRGLRDARAQLAARIRQASPRLAALEYPEPLDVESLQRALDPGTVLLSYAVGKDASRLFVVERRTAGVSPRLTVHALPVGGDELRRRVSDLRRIIERRGTTDQLKQARLEQSAQLFDLLVAPAARQVNAAERVLISPDGPLHSLPFAALTRRPPASAGASRPAQYFVEWKPIHTVVSATVYAELRRAPSAASRTMTLVAFGDPAYPTGGAAPGDSADAQLRALTRAGFSLEPLPAARDEVTAIGRHFGGRATLHLGAEATEARAKNLSSVRYLHFATHGLLDDRFPLNSALALTIPGRPDDGENGLLQAWEIFEQVRLDADLVTLSACETALGAEASGEGLLGLARAFHYAGARSVLGSLWSVADRSTATLMADVYRHLQDGVSKDEALRRAQRAAIENPETSDPFHWAGFTLSGLWR
jgi:CHAT domain-containing protein/Tfp pilus assembly protein PilF